MYGNDASFMIATCSPHTPVPAHFHPSLSPFHSLTSSYPPSSLSLSKQWSVTLSIQYNSPHRRAILAAGLRGDSITFFAECLRQMEK